MSPSELAKVAEWVEARWPGTRNFRDAEKFAQDFLALPDAAVWEAVRAYDAEGNKHAPTQSELKRTAREITRGRGLTSEVESCEQRGRHSRNWAVTDTGKTDAEGRPLREAQCVDCAAVVVRPAHQLLTVGEAADAARRAADPTDPFADRVAP